MSSKKPPRSVSQAKLCVSKKGYGIFKEGNEEVVEWLKTYLTVKPKINPEAPAGTAKEFSVYRENSRKLYVPVSLGFKLFGAPLPENYTLPDGELRENLVFHGTLRAEQRSPVASFLESASSHGDGRRGGIISLQCAAGKCLAKDTPVLMFDGTIRKVQNIVTGDVIMGDDSTPRRVQSTCCGHETLYKVIPDVGTPYVVNESHILSLKTSDSHTVIDIALLDYLGLPDDLKSKLHGYRMPVDFQPIAIRDNPYGVGRNLVINDEYFIPHEYKCNSRSVRLQVLAGIIDAVIRPHSMTFSHDSLANDVVFLVNSLGFTAVRRNNEVVISGKDMDAVPVLHTRNAFPTFDGSVSPIRVEELEDGVYYGFEIDGNRRFMLGDFTVTHNTVMGLYIVCALQRKALIVCHKEFLINQWRERIAQFIPTAKVGLIKGKVLDVKDKDIVLASLQSLSMKEFPPGTFDGIHTFVGDEIHHYSAEVFSRALTNIVTPISLGLSATLDRADGLRKVFEWYVGNPVVQNKACRTDTDMIVEVIQYYDPHPDFGRELMMWNNKRNIPRMQTNVCNFEPRNRMIVDKIEEIMKREPGRRVLVLSHRRAHLQQFEVLLMDKSLGTIGYYVGGMKEAELKASETKDIMLGTYSMIAEGFDVPALNTLILTTSMSSIEQSIGRIQRQKPEDRKFTPYVVDIWDTFSIFRNQGYKRLQFYKKNGYKIVGHGTCDADEKEDSAPKKYAFITDD
jgi:superfamily II DNA or RNA helicase